MEFLEFLLLLAAVLIILFRPEHERTAWWLTVGSWLLMTAIYVGHTSGAFLGRLNL
jgi:hypothetical protein